MLLHTKNLENEQRMYSPLTFNYVPTADGKWALDVRGYDLDDYEENAVFETYALLESDEV